jgi:hypothetical protein
LSAPSRNKLGGTRLSSFGLQGVKQVSRIADAASWQFANLGNV